MKQTLLFFSCCAAAFANAQVPATDWLRTAGGFSQFAPYHSAYDHNGHIYTAGQGSGMDYGNGVTVSTTGWSIACYTTDGDILWARALAAPGEIAIVTHIATNSAGDLWVVGDFWTATLTLDGTVLNNASTTSAFVARFDGNGDVQFAKAWGGSGIGASSTATQDVAIDALDRVYLTGGSSAAALDFGGGVSVTNSAGADQAFTVVLDAAGLAQWAVMSDSPGGGVGGLCITADPAGNAYVAMRFDGTLSLGGEELTTGITDHVALVKHTTMGTVEWMHPVAVCDPLDLTTDEDGNTYLCGDYQFTADFDGTVLTPSVLDGFVSAYTADGSFRWVTPVQGDIDNELCWSVALDVPQTSLVVGGTFVIGASFGGIPVQTGTSPTDGFVMHMDTAGTVDWVKDMTGDGPTLYAQACVDQDDRIYTSGTTQSMTTYLGEPVLNANGNNAFLARFDDLDMSVVANTSEMGLAMYPNPCDGAFTLSLPPGARTVIIQDALGRETARYTPMSRTLSLCIAKPGVYLVSVLTGHGQELGTVVVQ